jgi:hypothetical protein
MRCLACNRQLNDHESTRKYASSGSFVDLCDHCFGTVEEDIPTIEGTPPTSSDEGEYADDGAL